MSDEVVSSYIPTIGILLEPKRTISSSVDCNVLSIIQPATPGQVRLPGAVEELEKEGLVLATRSAKDEHIKMVFRNDMTPEMGGKKVDQGK